MLHFCICAHEAFKVVDLCKVIRRIPPLERSIARNTVHVFSEIANVLVAFVFVEILLVTRMRWGPGQVRISIINCVPNYALREVLTMYVGDVCPLLSISERAFRLQTSYGKNGAKETP